MGDDMLRTSKRRWRANRDRALSLYFLTSLEKGTEDLALGK
jgi:hypothetical protein